MCLPTCPTYESTKYERHSPRGRIALMRAVADGELAVNPAFAQEMSYCLGCLACQTACPAGVDYAELFETAREEIHGERLNSGTYLFWGALTLRLLLMRPRLLRSVGRIIRTYQQTGMDELARRLGIVRLLPEGVRRLEPQAPRIARAFSDELIPEVQRPIGREPRYRVALLTGCVQDLVFSDINRDTVDVLVANDCEVHTPPVQPCCGSLHAHNGEADLARRLAKRMIELFAPTRYDAIITNAGGCGSHLRHYERLLASDADEAERAREWDKRVRDIHEWLAEIGCRQPRAAPSLEAVTVTYHDSCHLAHSQKVIQQPRMLLKLLREVSFVELRESLWCCGGAGTYNMTQPEQSDILLERKIQKILESRATVVATANPGCHLQIAYGLKRIGAHVRVSHPISLLAAAYRREAIAVS